MEEKIEKSTNERAPYHQMDVGDLYLVMQENPSEDTLTEIKRAGIKMGHAGVVERACELLSQNPTRKELSDALRNAVGLRGFCIHDYNTAVGYFYQNLHGTDFLNTSVGTGDGQKTPYSNLPETMKEIVNMKILQMRKYISVQDQDSDTQNKQTAPNRAAMVA